MEYDFGNGLVPAHQHSFGGGWVANTARVEHTVYTDPTAKIYGTAYISGNAKILCGAEIFDATVYDAIISKCKVFGNSVVLPKARVFGDCSKSPIVLCGIDCYAVTICDKVITIGCTTDTLYGWKTRQDLTQSNKLRQYMDLIAQIAERHQGL